MYVEITSAPLVHDHERPIREPRGRVSGQKIMALFEFDQTKTGEVMELLGNRYVPYFGVPSFTYNIALWFEAKEALKMIGLA